MLHRESGPDSEKIFDKLERDQINGTNLSFKLYDATTVDLTLFLRGRHDHILPYIYTQLLAN